MSAGRDGTLKSTTIGVIFAMNFDSCIDVQIALRIRARDAAAGAAEGAPRSLTR